jgi:molybdate transport system ATP-binding protein
LDTTSTCILKVENVTVNRSGRNVLNGISFLLNKNENLAVVGPSGSGKTMLGLALAQKIFYKGSIHFSDGSKKISWVEQQHHFKTIQNTTDLYYQQRYNSYDTEATQTVSESLGIISKEANDLFREMKIEYLKDERLIQLSNGENKKLQLLKAQLGNPSVMILDQPFTGLDKETRTYLNRQINTISDRGIIIILITTPDEIPGCISKVALLENGELKAFDKVDDFRKNNIAATKFPEKKYDTNKLKGLLSIRSTSLESPAIIEMKNVSVQYDEKIILKGINWKVLSGERWLLSGPNGAGKSTLLSLITADNPKAYANNVFLFGKKRGSGESIWDIKKQIGFLSPELHLYFNQTSTCFETIASGIFDTIGLFRQLSQKEGELVNQWIEICRLKDLQNKRLYELSVGEQRVVLLTRALIKNPPLLILDEPCQGLDAERSEEFLELINEVCIAGNKTMIFVSHYENEVPACISRFIKLDKGQVKEII